MSTVLKIIRPNLRYTSFIGSIRSYQFVPRSLARSCCQLHSPRNPLTKTNSTNSAFRRFYSERKYVPRVSFGIPDEIWVLVIVGLGGIGLFTFTYYKKKGIRIKKKTDLQAKLAQAKQCVQKGEKEEASRLLKEVLAIIHNEIAEKQTDPAKKGKRPFHKALRYVLDQSAHLAMELERWDEAEHYLRLTLQEMLSNGTPKNDDAIIELSLKLSQVCEKLGKNELALEGYQWCVDTAESNLDQVDEADDNSKALLGLCLDGLGMFQLSLGQTDKAINNLESALEIAREVLGSIDEQTLVIMNNLAKAYAEANRYDEAETLALKTIKAAEETASDFRPVFMANLGSILLEKGKVQRAKKAFIKAFKLAEETDDDVTKTMIQDSLMKLDINVGHS